MFSKILVAVSANSVDPVLASALETARRYDAQLIALHVVDPTPCYMGAADCNFGVVVDALEAHGRRFVAQVAAKLEDQPHAGEARMIVLPLSGMTVGAAIVSVAEETGADLIMLGEHKASWWRWLNEDVALEVARCTDRPFQVVGRMTTSRLRRGAGRWTNASVAGAR